MSLASEEHADKLLVVDVAVLVLEAGEQLLGLLVAEAFAERGEQVAELGRVDHAAAVLVEDAQALDEVLLGGGVLLLAQVLVDGQELLERDTLDVQVLEALLDLGLSRIQAEGAYDLAEAVLRYALVALIVEQRERVAEVVELIVVVAWHFVLIAVVVVVLQNSNVYLQNSDIIQ